MAQPLIKFFRVAKIADLQATQKVQGGLYFETSTGVLYVYNGAAFEAYSGLKSASFADQKLVLTPSVGSALEIDLSGYVDSNEFNTELANYVKKDQTIAGIDLQDSITVEELKAALGLTDKNLGGEANAIETVQVNGDDLTIENETVNITVTEGTTNGTIAVNGKDVAVHGLGSAAYKAVEDFDAAGAADKVKTDLVNGETEFANFKAVGDELRDLEADKVADVTVGGVSVVNESNVAVLGTAAGKAIEDFDAAGAASKALEDAKKYTDEAKAELIGDATEAGNTLGKLEDRIETIVANEKTYSIAKVTEGLGSNIKEAYKLVDEDGTQCGTLIEIEKDDSLVDVVTTTDEKGNQVVKFTYNLADGTSKEITIDLSAYVTESEYGNGLQVVDHVVSVKRDEASEAFLSVSEAGVRLSGVQDAIDIAEAAAKKYTDDSIAALDATVGSQTVAEGKHIAVEVVETDGKLTGLTIVESDIASAKEVEENAQVTAAALNDLNERINAVDGRIPTELGVMSVAKGTDGKFVETTIGGTAADPTIGVSVTYTASTGEGTALATDAYVQEQINTAITDLVDAEGDSLVSASAAGNKVTVAATQDLKDAVSAANSAVQSVASAGETLQVSRTDNAVNVELAWTMF